MKMNNDFILLDINIKSSFFKKIMDNLVFIILIITYFIIISYLIAIAWLQIQIEELKENYYKKNPN